MLELKNVICWKCKEPFATYNWDAFRTCPRCLPPEQYIGRMYLAPEDFPKEIQDLVNNDLAKWEEENVQMAKV